MGSEARIVSLKEEKEAILLDTVEAQKQTALLDKKIGLERETQARPPPDPCMGMCTHPRSKDRPVHGRGHGHWARACGTGVRHGRAAWLAAWLAARRVHGGIQLRNL